MMSSKTKRDTPEVIHSIPRTVIITTCLIWGCPKSEICRNVRAEGAKGKSN